MASVPLELYIASHASCNIGKRREWQWETSVIVLIPLVLSGAGDGDGMGSGSLVIKHQRTKLLIRRWFSTASRILWRAQENLINFIDLDCSSFASCSLLFCSVCGKLTFVYVFLLSFLVCPSPIRSAEFITDGLLSELLPDVVADYAAECSSHSQLQQQHGSSSSSSRVFHHQGEPRKKMRKMKRDDVGVSDDLSLLSSAVDRWLVPLARRLHGRVALKRVRLRCQCSSGSSTTSSSTTSRRPCSKLRPVNDLRRAGRTDYFDSS